MFTRSVSYMLRHFCVITKNFHCFALTEMTTNMKEEKEVVTVGDTFSIRAGFFISFEENHMEMRN